MWPKPADNMRPVFVASFDPQLPKLQQIITKHWKTMTHTDSHLKDVFPKPPLVAFKQQRNLRDFLVRA